MIEGYIPEPIDRERVKSRCMRWLRTYSVRVGARGCMVEPVAGVITIAVDGTTGRVHVSGVKRCASPCPTCSFAIRNRRANEITALVEAAEARGHSALLLTLTIRTPPGNAWPTSWAC